MDPSPTPRRRLLRALVVVTIVGLIPWAPARADDGGTDWSVDLQFSAESHVSLYHFARSAAEAPEGSKWLRNVYEQHRTPDARDAVERTRDGLDGLPVDQRFHHDDLRRSQPFPGLTYREIVGGQVVQMSGPDAFRETLTGLLPEQHRDAFIRGLEGIAPLHRRRIWKPHASRLKRVADQLRDRAKHLELERWLAHIRHLLRARWPRPDAEIHLVPLPEATDETVAHIRSAPRAHILEVVPGDSDDARLREVIRSTALSLYRSRGPVPRRRLHRGFQSSGISAATEAEARFGRALASTIADGIFAHERADGIADEDGSYGTPELDAYAAALVSPVRAQLESEEPFDRSFAKRAARAYADRRVEE